MDKRIGSQMDRQSMNCFKMKQMKINNMKEIFLNNNMWIDEANYLLALTSRSEF